MLVFFLLTKIGAFAFLGTKLKLKNLIFDDRGLTNFVRKKNYFDSLTYNLRVRNC